MPAILFDETLLTLQAAAASLPGRPHISTLHRWRLRGVRCVRLEPCLVGGTRYTSREALQRFVDAITIAADGSSSAVRAVETTAYGRNSRYSQARASTVLDEARI
jgi:hypothetical protein